LNSGNYVAVLGTIPTGTSLDELMFNVRKLSRDAEKYRGACNIPLFTTTFFPSQFCVLPTISVEGTFLLTSIIPNKKVNENATIHAYDLARQARFEHRKAQRLVTI